MHLFFLGRVIQDPLSNFTFVKFMEHYLAIKRNRALDKAANGRVAVWGVGWLSLEWAMRVKGGPGCRP